MLERDETLRIVRECLEAVNAERTEMPRIALAENTELLNGDTALDSLEFLSFITHLESRVAKAVERDVPLAAEALSSLVNPFRTIGSLTDYIVARVRE